MSQRLGNVVEPGGELQAGGAAAVVSVGAGDPFHPRSVRTSMGSLFKLPTLRFDTSREAIAALDRLGACKIGAVSSGGSPLPRLDPGDGPIAVIVGSEAFGLEPRLANTLDERVTIPMREGVDSYSVNAAAAILLYELGHRRE